jgi:Tfp pilus assembly protein PilE
VEVIVVLVILAILAAIAIPALTGYIAKAQDKKWEMKAKDAAVAVRAVLDEAYADGTMMAGTSAAITYMSKGRDDWFRKPEIKNKQFQITTLSSYNPGAMNDPLLYFRRAAELMGEVYPDKMTDSGHWEVRLIAPKTPVTYTVLNAPMFWYLYFPEGNQTTGDGRIHAPSIGVTYGIGNLNATYDTYLDLGNAIMVAGYDPSAGYKVFHLTN